MCYSEAINNIRTSGRGTSISESYYDTKDKDSFFVKSIEEYRLNSCAKTPTESLNISAHDGNGNSIKADVYVDDNKIGTTPGVFKVPGCSFKLMLKAGNNYFYKKLNPREGTETTFIEATLKPELQWSKKATKVKSPEQYCKNLNEDGHKDWRLPTIDDFKTAVNCPSNLNGGICEFYIKSYKSLRKSDSEEKHETKDEEMWVSSEKGTKISSLGEDETFAAAFPNCPNSYSEVVIKKRGENGKNTVYFQSICSMDKSEKKESAGDYNVRCVR